MKFRVVLGLLVLSLAVLGGAAALAQVGGGGDGAERERRPVVSFARYDIVIETGGPALGAWQVEIGGGGAGAEVIGVRGGDAQGVWAEPATYDPLALNAARLAELRGQDAPDKGVLIVLAAYTLDAAAPGGDVWVGSVNVMVTGDADAPLDASLVAAAGLDGERIEDARLRLERIGQGER